MSGVVSTALEVVAVLAATHLAARLVAGDGSMVVVYNSARILQLISVLVLVIGLWLWSGLVILLGAKHDAAHVGHGISETQRGRAGTRHRLDGLARWYLISCPLPTIVLSIASLLENQFCFCAGMYGYGAALWALGMLALRGGWVGALNVHAGKQPADAGGPLLKSSLMNLLSDGRHRDDVNRETASQRYCAAFAYRSRRGILARLCGAAVLFLRCGAPDVVVMGTPNQDVEEIAPEMSKSKTSSSVQLDKEQEQASSPQGSSKVSAVSSNSLPGQPENSRTTQQPERPQGTGPNKEHPPEANDPSVAEMEGPEAMGKKEEEELVRRFFDYTLNRRS